jgi:hypothetical protein
LSLQQFNRRIRNKWEVEKMSIMTRGTHMGTLVDTPHRPGHTPLHMAIHLLQVGTHLRGILPKGIHLRGILPKGTLLRDTLLLGMDIHQPRLRMVAILQLLTQEPAHLILVWLDIFVLIFLFFSLFSLELCSQYA